uniref:Uncharacterized protein n=1 Tax=Glossina austeni TaxID=7395 RepID=A0A1A9VCP1_GLOAU
MISARGPSTSYLPPSYAVSKSPSHFQSADSGSLSLHQQYAASSVSHGSAYFGQRNTPSIQIPIIRNDYNSDGAGNYNFGYSLSHRLFINLTELIKEIFRFYYESFETGNGIKRDENGEFHIIGPDGSLNVHGSYSYTGDDGRVYSVNYKADSNGFHAVGAHLPTPPPTSSRAGLQAYGQHGLEPDNNYLLPKRTSGYDYGKLH